MVSLRAELRDDPLPGAIELVPGARTVLVRFAPHPRALDLEAIRAQVIERDRATRALGAVDSGSAAGAIVEIPVVYDGDDLDDVARLTGLSREEVVRRHTAAEYTVAFTGFAPGFGYLVGGDPALAVPRRPQPRTAVPAGAVGLAGEFSGVYPRRSPGGWQLIGRTGLALFDANREPAALLEPGTRVRFVEALTTDVAPAASAASAPAPAPAPAQNASESTASRGLEVTSLTGSATVQDAGRPGRAGLGISPSGAMDAGALRRAQRAVGAAPDTAGIEIAGAGMTLRVRGDLVLAATGAIDEIVVEPRDAPDDTADNTDPDDDDTNTGPHTDTAPPPRHPPVGAAFAVADGDLVHLTVGDRGVYGYLVAQGGLPVRSVLGSRSTDTLSGLGPPRLAAGTVLPVGADRGSVATELEPELPDASAVVTVRIVDGPRHAWFTDAARDALESQEWQVTPQADRVGVRLAGVGLERRILDELPSEAVVAGAIQVPADGQPLVFLRDHPVTGGYPVIACVVADDLDRVVQAPPGSRLRFRRVEPLSPSAPARGGAAPA